MSEEPKTDEECKAGGCPTPLKAQLGAMQSISEMLLQAIAVLSSKRAGPMCPRCPMLVVIRGWATSATMMASLLEEQLMLEGNL